MWSLWPGQTDHAKSEKPSLEKGYPPEIVVGFDIGMTHGTVSLGFTNGTFQDIVRLKAGPAYQARVLQRLQGEGLVKIYQSLWRHGNLTDDHSSNISYLGRAWKSVRILLRLEVPSSTTVNSHTEPRNSDPAQSDLEALITGLKTKTEEVFQDHIRYLTVTTPRFLPQAHRSDIELALSKASLNLSSCREIEDSIVASTIATRFLQQPPAKRESISHVEWLLGPFRVEEVIAMLCTKNLLALSVFKLYTGKTTWIEEDFRHFVAVGDVLKPPNGLAAGPDLNFWNDVIAGMRKTALWPSTVFGRTLRLVLQGPSPLKPEIVSLLESAFGKLLPSPSQPYAVRMIFNEEQCKKKNSNYSNSIE